MADSIADQLNASCRCITVDRDALAERLEARADTAGLYASICANQPNLFASLPVFVSRAHVDAMRGVIEAVERALAVAAVRDALLSYAPEIARVDHGPRGVFLGYDFHLGPDGPRLIEINTNAGGALLNAALGAAQKACCDEVDVLMSSALASGAPGLDAFEDEIVAMFRAEWRLARGEARSRASRSSTTSPRRSTCTPSSCCSAACSSARVSPRWSRIGASCGTRADASCSATVRRSTWCTTASPTSRSRATRAPRCAPRTSRTTSS